MKQRIIIAALISLCYTLVIEGKPQLYSCNLKIRNTTTNIGFEYQCNHEFGISEDGPKIPSNGVTGLITNETGCACEEVEHLNSTRDWAAVVKYNVYLEENDCSINHKVGVVADAGYTMILLVSSDDCHGNKNTTDYGTPRIPIINIEGESLRINLLELSRPTSQPEYAAEIRVEAVYVDFALLWTVFGVTVAITITSTICCFCTFFVFRGLATKLRRQGLSRWSLRKLPQRKYMKGEEAYETCAICLEEFEDAETIRVLPCSHIYHSKCVDEWLMKWNRVCPVCKRVILRNERSEGQVVTDQSETGPTSPETTPSESASVADNASDSRTVESIPLLVSIHESTESRTHGYGSVAENTTEGPDSQNALESFASMQNDVFSEESVVRSGSSVPPSAAAAGSDHSVIV